MLALRQLRPIWRAAPPSPQAAAARDSSAALSPIWSVFVLTLLVSALRSWAQFATTTFTPKFLHDLGELPAFYGLVVALFMGGSAVGGVLGALVADRGGYRLPVTVALAAGAVPLYFMPVSGTLWMLPLAAAAGLLNGAPHSVLVTMAQRALPGRAALASGLILGLMFAAGSLGAYFSGLAADRLGLAVVLQGNALISLAAAALSLALRRT